MKRIVNFFITFVLLLGFSVNTSAREIAGVHIPETLEYAGTTMQLNGAGVRKKAFIKLYIASLYLTEKENDADKILSNNSPMAIHLNIKSSLISTKKMKAATLEGFEKSTAGDIAPIKAQVDEMLSAFDQGVSSGDSYTMLSNNKTDVDVVKNGKKVTTIKSEAFKKALFGIWLSKSPVQESLKNEMLGM